MAKRRMSKGAGGIKGTEGKGGARSSKKHQVSALLPQNKVGGEKSSRSKRMAKMEKADMPV